MPSPAHRAVDAQISAILETADAIMKRTFDSDLIDKVTVLRGYWELSQMVREQDYSSVLLRALAELWPMVRCHLTGDEVVMAGAHYMPGRTV